MSFFARCHIWTTDSKTLPESYGGHYGPVFNEYIESQNAKAIPGAHNISLQTVLVGNGWYDPLIQVNYYKTCCQGKHLTYLTKYQAYYNFTVTGPSQRRGVD